MKVVLRFGDLIRGRFFTLKSDGPRQILFMKVSDTHAQDLYTKDAEPEPMNLDTVVTGILFYPERISS